MNENVDPKAKLRGGNCVQDAPDPFILPRDRVSSAASIISECIQINEEHKTFESGQLGQRQ